MIVGELEGPKLLWSLYITMKYKNPLKDIDEWDLCILMSGLVNVFMLSVLIIVSSLTGI